MHVHLIRERAPHRQQEALPSTPSPRSRNMAHTETREKIAGDIWRLRFGEADDIKARKKGGELEGSQLSGGKPLDIPCK